MIALSLSSDRERCADLLIEGAGLWWIQNDNPRDLKKFLKGHGKTVAKSIVESRRDSHVVFERAYVSLAYIIMKS